MKKTYHLDAPQEGTVHFWGYPVDYYIATQDGEVAWVATKEDFETTFELPDIWAQEEILDFLEIPYTIDVEDED